MGERTGLSHVAFYPSDWLAGTRGLSAAETGVYITLVAMMYERGEKICMDDARLARLCGTTTSNFRKALSALIEQGKVTQDEAGLWNLRVQKQLNASRNLSRIASENANARWEKTKQKQEGDDAGAMQSQCGDPCDPDATQNQNQNIPPIVPQGGRSEVPPPFSEFWETWPHKTAKKNAERAWKKLSSPDKRKAIDAVPDWWTKWRAAHPDANPIHPATWLNGKRWEDQFSPPKLSDNPYGKYLRSAQ